MSITVICPLYNASKCIENLHNSLLSQKNVKIDEVKYVLTESTDNTENFLVNHKLTYDKIKKSDFSHSLSREKAALASTSDIIVFITQDIIIEDNLWLYNLTKDINGKIVATYSRQLTKYNNLEKYTRESNYSAKSIVKSQKDIKKLGLKTFFFSDAASAISTKVFKKLNGYDHKNLPISEDMYIAHKIITSGYQIKYCADSVVYHSHNFTLKQLYDRYKLTGQFFKQNPELDQYGTTGSGSALAKYILKRIIEEHRFALLFRYPFDMSARLLGMKAGQR